MDLRKLIRILEKEGELRTLRQPVDVKYEIGAICYKELQQGMNHNKALMFEQVRGFSVPLVTNLLASPKRFILALNPPSAQSWHQFWIEKTSHPVHPRIVDNAPCQEVIGHHVKLSDFPIPLWNEKDGGHYLSMTCVISKDPDTNQRNCGVYRMMVHDDWNSAGILAPPYRHIAAHLAKSSAKGNALPVAVALGVSPALTMAAAADFPYGTDEIAMAGALQGEPVEMTPCQTIPLEVPAHAEVVLEGSITPGEEKEEGPFGEFTGYYGARGNRPVFKINLITHRRDPIAVGTYVGRPPQENAFLNSQLTEVEIIRQCPLPGIKDLFVNPAGALNAVVSIQKLATGDSKTTAMAILSTDAGRRIKTLVVVDDDINPRDNNQVSWALAYRMRPDKDVAIVKGMTGVTVDPSMPEKEILSGTNRMPKMIIDATRPDQGAFAEECLPKRQIIERIEAEWHKYA